MDIGLTFFYMEYYSAQQVAYVFASPYDLDHEVDSYPQYFRITQEEYIFFIDNPWLLK